MLRRKAHRLKPVPQGAAAELGEGGQALRYRKARRRMRGAQASTDVDKGKAYRLKPVPQGAAAELGRGCQALRYTKSGGDNKATATAK
jgi:hypothetical protein